jgi:hypothetical protein
MPYYLVVTIMTTREKVNPKVVQAYNSVPKSRTAASTSKCQLDATIPLSDVGEPTNTSMMAWPSR